ncbi:MAG: PaaI family thioesterase [Rhodoblastus sp.]
MTAKPDPAQEARIRADFDKQGMMRTLGASLSRIAPGEVEIVMPFSPGFAQHHGFAHAGALTAIVDNACGFAALTLMPQGMQVLTVEFKANFLKPGIGEKFIAIGRVKRAGRQISVVEGEVIAQDSSGVRTTIALMLATMMGVRLEERSVRG